MTIKQQGGIFGRNPTFNDVETNKLDVDNITIDGNTISTSSGDLNLSPTDNATFTNGSLSVKKSGDAFADTKGELFVSSNKYAGLATEAGARIVLKSDNTTAWSGGREMVALEYVGNGADHRAGSLSIKVKKGAGDADPTEMLLIDGVRNTTTIKSGNLAFPSGAGIDFSATADTSASGATTTSELFSDYEEGSWSPVLEFGGASVGVTYSVQSGSYTKIGNLVTGRFIIVLSNKGSSTGTATISGLPYTVGSLVGNVSLSLASNFSTNIPEGGYAQNAPNSFVLWSAGATGTSLLSEVNFNNNTRLDMSFSYSV